MEFGIPWELLLATAVPPIVQALKDRLRMKPWAVPLLAIACGVGVQAAAAGVQQLAGVESGTWQPILGAVLGVLGVGLRELTVQLMRGRSA